MSSRLFISLVYRQFLVQTVGAHRGAWQGSVSKINMVHSDSPSGDESSPTEAAPTAAAFVDTIMERMAQQDAVQKVTNEQLAAIAAIAAILAPLAGNPEDSATTIRRQLFDTFRTAGTGNPDTSDAQTHGDSDLTTIRELSINAFVSTHRWVLVSSSHSQFKQNILYMFFFSCDANHSLYFWQPLNDINVLQNYTWLIHILNKVCNNNMTIQPCSEYELKMKTWSDLIKFATNSRKFFILVHLEGVIGFCILMDL